MRSPLVRVLAVVIVVLGLSVAPATAGEWHANGDKTFALTHAGMARFTVAPTSGPHVSVDCVTTGSGATLTGATSAALPWPHAITVSLSFGSSTGCTVSGVNGYTILCSPAAFAATGYAGGTTLATAGGGVTTGPLANIDCRLQTGITTCSTIAGTLGIDVINPNPIASGTGSLTVTTVGQALTVTKIGAGCAAVPNGTATFGKPGAGGSVTDLTYLATGPNAPYIFRTP